MQIATNPQTGEKVQWNGTAWVPLAQGEAPASAAPQAPAGPITIGTPRKEKPNLPTGYEMGDDGTAHRIPGLPAPSESDPTGNSAKVRADAVQAYTDAAALERLADTLESQYQQGPGTTHGIAGVTDYLPTPTNKTFNATADQARGRVKRALGFTGGEGNTIGEVQLNYGPFIPQASDYDITIEGKIQSLRQLAKDSRARAISVLGGEPDANGMVTPVPAQKETAPTTSGSNALAEIYEGNNGQGGPMAPATDYIRQDDPALAGVKGEYLRRLAAGQSAGDLIKWVASAGVSMNTELAKSIADQVRFRREHPNIKLSNYDVSQIDDRLVPTTDYQKAMSSAAQTAPGAAAISAGDTASLGTLDNIVGATGGNAEQARIALQDSQNRHPTASLAGSVAGGATTALGGEAALARLGLSGAAAPIVADTAYGAAYGAGSADEGNRGLAALYGAGAGLVGNRLGAGASRGLGALASGVTNPAVGYATREALPLTIGQAVGKSGRLGGMVKGLEDRAAGLPIVGDMINARRAEGVRAMNAKAFDKALEPIGGSVSGKVGDEAVAAAQNAVSGAFQKALQGKTAGLDHQFIAEARAAKQSIASIPRISGEVENSIDEAVASYFDPNGNISGENMQALLRDLGAIKQSYRGDPLGHRVSRAVGKVEDAVENLFKRQAPDVMPQYNAAKQAFRRVSILEDAVLRAKNNKNEVGVFTPGQLGMADRANAVKFSGKHSAAAGGGEFHDFHDNMQQVLPNNVPDSGTVGRAAIPVLALAGAGGGAGVGAATGDTQGGATTGLTLAGLLSLAYSKTGQRALVAAAAKRGAGAKAVGQAVKKSARMIGHAGAATTAVESSN